MRTGRTPRSSKLYDAIKASGYTRHSFADKFGYSCTNISAMSYGSIVPTLQLAIRIAKDLSCRPCDLFDVYKIGDNVYTISELRAMLNE